MTLCSQNISDVSWSARESWVVFMDEALKLIQDIVPLVKDSLRKERKITSLMKERNITSLMKANVREQAMVPQEDVDRMMREAEERGRQRERASLKRKIQEHGECMII